MSDGFKKANILYVVPLILVVRIEAMLFPAFIYLRPKFSDCFCFLTTNQWKRDVYILIHQSISLHYFLELTPVRLVPSSLYKKKKNFKVPIISVLLNKMDSSEFLSYFTFQHLFIQMTSHSFFSKILELGFWDTILKIALQCCVCFCRTTTWIGHSYIHVLFMVSPLTSPHPTTLGHHRVPGWGPCVIMNGSFPLALYFTHDSV